MKASSLEPAVVGVTTAYYLAKSGHEVSVVEREAEVAPWRAPATPDDRPRATPSAGRRHRADGAVRSLTVEDTASVESLQGSRMAAWGLKFRRECNAGRSAKNTLVKAAPRSVRPADAG